MKCALICDEGFEDYVAKKLEEFKVTIEKIETTCIIFEAENYEITAKISYLFHSAIKVLTDIEEFPVTIDLEETIKEIKVDSIKDALKNLKNGPMKVQCVRKGEHNYRSVDLGSEISRTYFKDYDKEMKTPLIEIFTYVKEEKGYIGIDFTGRTLSKRDYKIFNTAGTLRGSLAYNSLLIADVKENEFILDPFMGSGTIVIEAALAFSKVSPFFFTKEKFAFTKFIEKDWEQWFKEQDNLRENNPIKIHGFDSLLKMLKYTQKNAKIADINKQIKVTMCAIDWLDTKLEEDCVDKIVTNPPYLTDHTSKTKMNKIYKDLFHQADFILKKKGTVTIITNENSKEAIINAAKLNNFKCFKELVIFEGQQEMRIVQFKQEQLS